jgi:hypothetical protein
MGFVVQLGLRSSEGAVALMRGGGFLLEHNKIMGGISVALPASLLLQGGDPLLHVGQCRMQVFILDHKFLALLDVLALEEILQIFL